MRQTGCLTPRIPARPATMSIEHLNNVAWRSLIGPHARFAVGAGSARRYAPGYTPIVGVPNPKAPDFDELARICGPGEQLYIAGWSGMLPGGWTIDFEASVNLMVWAGDLPDESPAFETVELTPTDLPDMLALVELTHPGPFGVRTPELGDYLGIVQDGHVIAMAGERMSTGQCVEISGVCTHPVHQGRGIARLLVEQLIRRELARGALPFLNVVRTNTRAHSVYERMGFRDHDEHVLRVVSRLP
jgi:GNAT superfamily N-acetyltransferase